MGKRGRQPIPHKNENGIELKYCRTCEEWKPLTDFTTAKNTTDKLTTQCRACINLKNRERYFQNPQQYRPKNNEKNRDYYRNNLEKYRKRLREQSKERNAKLDPYCSVHRGRLPKQAFSKSPHICDQCYDAKQLKEQDRIIASQIAAEKAETNRLKKLQKHEAHLARIAYRQTPEYLKEKHQKEIEYDRARRKTNPQKHKGKMTAYYKNNPGKRREHKLKRKDLCLTARGKYSPQDWDYIKEITGHKCLKCGTTDKKLAPDHIVPLGIGSNTLTNIQPYCWGCNAKKGRRWIEDNRDDQTKYLVYQKAFPNLIAMIQAET